MVMMMIAAFSLVFGGIMGYAVSFFFSAQTIVGQTIAGVIGGGIMAGLASSVTGDPNKISGSGLVRFVWAFVFGALGGIGTATDMEIYRVLLRSMSIRPFF